MLLADLADAYFMETAPITKPTARLGKCAARDACAVFTFDKKLLALVCNIAGGIKECCTHFGLKKKASKPIICNHQAGYPNAICVPFLYVNMPSLYITMRSSLSFHQTSRR